MSSLLRVRVTDVIERDTDRILFAGLDPHEQRVTFHIMITAVGAAEHIADLVTADQPVEVDLPVQDRPT